MDRTPGLPLDCAMTVTSFACGGQSISASQTVHRNPLPERLTMVVSFPASTHS
jgi:hypothetical protein